MKKLLVTATILMASMSSFAAFTAGMSEADRVAEVAKLGNSVSIAEMATQMANAGLPADQIAFALIKGGKNPEAVVGVMITRAFNAGLTIQGSTQAVGIANASAIQSIMNAAIQAGARSDAVITGAINGGVDPTVVSGATAAGGTTTPIVVGQTNTTFTGFVVRSSTNTTTSTGKAVSGS
ncbi:hypothetical protein [Rhodoferax aquaticus]|uniref:Uncharacterized protein n=1 Tax=Rhodoferax aquaticus TaxID=2527691 RepID=A0A515EPH5_9BURK|nr:hypothetical protein [Rhodoferax aquaticus]QDL54571.1 hypothetical protein EXZ61_10555 [Rhodoferax aquaticus]